MEAVMVWLGQNPMVLIAILSAIVAAAIAFDRVRTHIKSQGARNAACDADMREANAWRSRVDADRESFGEFMREMRGMVNQILNRLPQPSPLSSASPLRLNDLGEKVSSQAGGKDWAVDHAEDVRKDTAGMSPYDIQEHCFEYVKDESRFDAEQMEKIKAAAFKNGMKTDMVLRVLAVELRDQLLSEDQLAQM